MPSKGNGESSEMGLLMPSKVTVDRNIRISQCLTYCLGDVSESGLCLTTTSIGNGRSLRPTTTSIGIRRNIWRLLLHKVLEGIYGDYYFKGYQKESMATTISKDPIWNLWRQLLQKVPEGFYGD